MKNKTSVLLGVQFAILLKVVALVDILQKLILAIFL